MKCAVEEGFGGDIFLVKKETFLGGTSFIINDHVLCHFAVILGKVREDFIADESEMLACQFFPDSVVAGLSG